MTATTLKNQLNLLQDKKMLVLGDIMLDEYHWCDVSRISPEAPVPICKVNQTTLVPGGAANVAHNIKALGAIPYLLGVVGKDTSADRLIATIENQNISTDFIIKDAEKPTTLKSRVVAHHQHVIRLDREESQDISRRLQNQLLGHVNALASEIDGVIISDYMKGTLPATFLKKLIVTCTAHNIKVAVDPKGDTFGKYKNASILTPNFSEFQNLIKKPLDSEKRILTEGLKLIEKLGLDALLVTRSEKGMSVISAETNKVDIPTKAREVYDITGAGDTVISILGTGLAAGLSIQDAAWLANYGAGIVVGKVGTSTTTTQEIATAISHDETL